MAIFQVKTADVARFKAELRAALTKMRDECTEVYRGYTTAVFHWVAMETPQWSGNAAANWNVAAGAPDLSVNLKFKENSLRFVPKFSKGWTQAPMDAVRRASGALMSLSLTAPTVFISNAAEGLDNKRYIMMLEENPNNFLRPENEPGQMLQRVAYRAFMGRIHGPRKEALRRLKPGQLNNPGVDLAPGEA